MMSRKEWAIGNSGEICAYCHKHITEICGCGANDLKFKNLFKQLGDLTIKVSQQAALLQEAVEVVMNLNQLIRNSQDVMSIYLQPDGDMDMAIDHLLYLLDGPEQRTIQTKAQALLPKLEAALEKKP